MLTRPGIDSHLPTLLARVGQLVVTFGLAELSYRWIESPIRHQEFRSSLHSWQATFKLWSIPQKLGVGAGIVSAGLLPVRQSSPLAQAELIDWNALAHTQQEWFIEDQTHLSYAGSQAYITAIQEKLETAP